MSVDGDRQSVIWERVWGGAVSGSQGEGRDGHEASQLATRLVASEADLWP